MNNSSMFQRFTITGDPGTVPRKSARDRCASGARNGWKAIRTSTLPAEAVIGLVSSPAGYDAVLDVGTTAAKAMAKGARATARASRRAGTAVTVRLVAGIGRVHRPAAASAATAATAADAYLGVLAEQLSQAAGTAGARIQQAATSPEVRKANTMTANAARMILTIDRITSGALAAQAARRSVVAGRVAKASTNPWILLGTVAASFVIVTGVALIRAAAATASPVASSGPVAAGRPVTVTGEAPARAARTRPTRKAAAGGKPSAGSARVHGTGGKKAA
jgi:hypothetical protein